MGIPTLRDAQFSVVYYCKDGAAVPSALKKAGVGTGSSSQNAPLEAATKELVKGFTEARS